MAAKRKFGDTTKSSAAICIMLQNSAQMLFAAKKIGPDWPGFLLSFFRFVMALRSWSSGEFLLP